MVNSDGHEEGEDFLDNLKQIDEDMNVPEEQELNEINDKAVIGNNTAQVLVKDTDEVGVVHMVEDIEDVHP